MLAYLHPDPEVFCIPAVLILIGVLISILIVKKLLPKDYDK
jgi:hypothetical protein